MTRGPRSRSWPWRYVERDDFPAPDPRCSRGGPQAGACSLSQHFLQGKPPKWLAWFIAEIEQAALVQSPSARGGRAPKMTALRRAAAEQDDNLREQARRVLERALAGEDVPKSALDSARSLFSYRADAPPVDEQPRTGEGGGKIVGLTDLVEVMAESRFFSRDFGLSKETERQLLENVRARKASRQAEPDARLNDSPSRGP
jgi:hypothetical protein